MSVQVVRDGFLTERRTQREALLRKRSARIRQINVVTAAITKHVGLPHSLQTDFNTDPPPPLTSEETQLLDALDLTKGRHYSDSAFPVSLDSVYDAVRKSFPPPVAVKIASQQPETETDISEAVVRDLSTEAGIAVASHPQADNVQQTGTHEVSLIVPDTTVADEAQATPREQTQAEHEGSAQSSQGVSSPSSPAAATSGTTPLPGDVSPATSVEGQSNKKLGTPDSTVEDASKGRVGQVAVGQDAARTKSPIASTSKTPIHAPINAASRDADQTISSPRPIAVSIGAQDPPTKFNSNASNINTDRPQRMQTRVASGVLRQKSVSEILDESPKNTPRRKSSGLRLDRASSDAQSPKPTPSSRLPSEAMPAPPPPVRQPLHLTHEPSTTEPSLPLTDDGYASLQGAADDPNRDYFEPLYRIQAQDPPNGRSISELVHKASKAISTADLLTCHKERQDHRILKRIYGLQYSNHWSLRQMEPWAEVPAPKTHWDYLIDEAVWMRTDFRQERKEKRSIAKFLAQQCAAWVDATPEQRSEMQVRVRSPTQSLDESGDSKSVIAPQSPAATNNGNGDLGAADEEAVPDLEPSNSVEQSPSSTDPYAPLTPHFAIIPDILLDAVKAPGEGSLLLESDDFLSAVQDLPLYVPFDEVTSKPTGPHPAGSDVSPSVSKFGSGGKLVAKTEGQARKRSRYDFEDEVEDHQASKRPRLAEGRLDIQPEETAIALFTAENQPIKDKLHAINGFRPPAEFQMPSEKFYEWRLASQWTFDDDQKLRQLFKEHGCNWSFISDQMQLPSHFHGAADRRTPWECFERWVELESLPPEMRKTTYFRVWGSKIENAVRMADSRYQAQLRHHNENAPPNSPAPVKRRTMPTKVEKRRSGRYLHLIDAMRKLARKREQQAHKQAEAQKAASMRKQHNEPVQQKNPIHTPQEFSKLRHERELQQQARTERMREAMLAQHKAAQMQRPGQNPQQAAAAAQQQRQAGQPMQQAPNAQMQTPAHVQNAINAVAQQNGRMPNGQMPNSNGHLNVPNAGMQGNVPQAPMQANMRANGARQNQMSQEQMQRLAMQAQLKNPQMQNNQQLRQLQQQQSMVSPGGNPNMNGSNGEMNNQAAMLAAMQAGQQGNARQNSGFQMNNMNANGPISPHMPPPNMSQPKQLSSGHVPAINQIKHSLQGQHPNASSAQIDQMANEQMRKHAQAVQARQNAVSAAAGTNYANMNKSNSMQGSNFNNYDHNQMAYNQNNGMAHNQQSGQMGNFNSANGALSQQQTQQHQQYSQLMRQRLLAQQQQQAQQSQLTNPNMASNGSPHTQQANASPNMMHVSPVMQQALPNMGGGSNMNMGGANMGMGQPRPPSRSMSGTPQMVRISSSGGNGMVSPGIAQGSPRAQMVNQ